MSQPPYGSYPGQRPPNSGISPWVGYLVGALVLGPILAVFCPSLALLIGAGTLDAYDSGDGFVVAIIAGLVAPLLLPIPLLFTKPTRPWGVGILIGVALTLIVLGGLCAAIIASLNYA